MDTYESDGVRIAYLDEPGPAGASLPIILVHGFASTHAVNWVVPQWVKTLTEAGRRVVAPDNRGHGASGKPRDPAAYAMSILIEDVRRLLDHLSIERADVMGYSMGARIAAFLAAVHPNRVRRIVLGGLGARLVDGTGLPDGVADAMDAADPELLTDPDQRLFRRFADRNGADRAALSACVRGSRQALSLDQAAGIACPALVAVGTRDPIAGDPHRLAALLPRGEAFDIPDRDHNLAVGDKLFKRRAVEFLDSAVSV